MGSLLSGIFGVSTSALAAAAIKEMPTIVADIYNEVKGILAPAPTSSAEVGVAAAILKAIPSLTAAQLSSIKTIYGIAVAEWKTQNPNGNVNDPNSAGAMQTLADDGVSSRLGLDTTKFPITVKMQLLMSAIVVFSEGMGVQALNTTA